ncbi:MAG: succinate dehydrogenase, cytochrome b556 subunit [Sphingorhabdus sp.]
MGQTTSRPLSPHLSIYKRGVHMMASIMHRATGFVLATAGMLTLLWWLAAIGGGEESYAQFLSYIVDAGDEATSFQSACNWFFRLLALAVTFSFFQHLFSGIRHLMMDMGAGFELNSNRMSAWAVFIAAFTATGIVALYAISKFVGV